MKRRIMVLAVVATACVAVAGLVQAQDKKAAAAGGAADDFEVITARSQAQRAFSAVGSVEYVEFNRKKQSVIGIKDKDGKVTEVVLDNIKPGSQMLATYRKEKDAKGKEQNVAVTLSVIRVGDSK